MLQKTRRLTTINSQTIDVVEAYQLGISALSHVADRGMPFKVFFRPLISFGHLFEAHGVVFISFAGALSCKGFVLLEWKLLPYCSLCCLTCDPREDTCRLVCLHTFVHIVSMACF